MAALSWKDMAETMQSLAAALSSAAEAYCSGRLDEARSAYDRSRSERSRLKLLRQYAREAMPQTPEEIAYFAATQEAVEQANSAEASLSGYFSSLVPLDNPLSTEGLQRTLDSGIPDAWDFETDLVVVLGADSGGFIPLLKLRGFNRVLWVLREGDNQPEEADGVLIAKDLEDALVLCCAYDLKPPTDMVLVAGKGVASADEQTMVSRALEERLQSAAMTHKTLAERGHEFVLNITKNVPSLARCGTVPRLSDIASGRPAIIVCPGPSLEKSIQALKTVQDRALVIVVNHALSAVQKHGITPDLVVAADSKPAIANHLQAGSLDEVGAFALGVSVHPNVFKAVEGKPVFSFMGNPAAEFWLDDLVSPPEKFPLGGTVAHGAAMLALSWRCDPVVFVGQDLAYSNGSAYASGTDFAAKFEISPDRSDVGTFGEERQRLYWVRSWGEEKLATSVQFLMYKAWYEEMVKAEPGTRFINCSEDGAYIEGMEHVPLAELVESVFLEPWDAGSDLRARVKTSSTGEVADTLSHLDERRTQLMGIAKLADDCCALIENASRTPEEEADLKKLEKQIGAKQGGLPELTILLQEAIQRISSIAEHVRSREHANEISLSLYTAIGEAARQLVASYSSSYETLSSSKTPSD